MDLTLQDFVIGCAVLLLLLSGKRITGFGRRLGEGVARSQFARSAPADKRGGILLPLGISLLLYCLFLVLAMLSRR